MKIINDNKVDFKRCSRCGMSNTRPRIQFDKDGVCSSCRYWDEKEKVDWDSRWNELKKICKQYQNSDGWNCIVPCSGGKDSLSVAIRLRDELGMHPLTVTVAGCLDTNIGKTNYDNIVLQGFDNVYINPNKELYWKLCRYELERFGDIFKPYSDLMWSGTIKTAIQYKIPLMVFSENGELEYGGTTKYRGDYNIDAEFIRTTQTNLDINHWKDKVTNNEHLSMFQLPTQDELDNTNIKIIHLGSYMNWKPWENYQYAKQHGFVPLRNRSEGTYTDFASLDDQFDGFHYWFMYLKFGICRATSDACHEVREGRITREKAIELIQKHDGEYPWRYHDTMLECLNLSEEQYWDMARKWVNERYWKRIGDNKWQLKDKEVNKILEIPVETK